MVECEFCGDEFDEEKDLHAHWSEHEDELNSHQKDKMKKAKREKEEKAKEKKKKRKKQAVYAMGGVLALGIAALIVPQLISQGGETASQYNLSVEGQPTIGDENASVTVIEFGDYRCPYCREFEMSTFPQIKENYVDTGEVKFSFINLAFLGQGSEQAANAAECVYRQNKTQFWDFHKELYSNQGSESENWVTQNLLMEVARDSTEGLDYDELQSCFSSRDASDEVREDRGIATENGVESTPTVFVNGEKIQGNDYSAVSSAIERELQ